MSKPKNMTPEQEAAWIVRKREIARESYKRNKADRIARVAAYKKKKIAEKPPKPGEEYKRQSPKKCQCGKTAYPATYRIPGLCARCSDEKKSQDIKDNRAKELANKNSYLRKWYRWICKNDHYDKCVRIHGTVMYVNDFLACEVLELEPAKSVKTRTIESGPFAGMKFPDVVSGYFINGYYRVQSSDGYRYLHGKAGIPHERLGRAAQEFSELYWRETRLFDEKREQAQREREILKRIESLQTKVKNINNKISGMADSRKAILSQINFKPARKIKRTSKRTRNTMFFRMLAGARSISEYAQTINQ